MSEGSEKSTAGQKSTDAAPTVRRRPPKLTAAELARMTELNARALTLRYGLDDGTPRTVAQVAKEMSLGKPAVQYHLKKGLEALSPDRRERLRNSIVVRRGRFAQPLKGNTPSAMFANRLMEIRKARGLSQEQMASLLGLEFVTYNAYESGRNRPRMDTFFQMCERLGMSPSEVLQGI